MKKILLLIISLAFCSHTIYKQGGDKKSAVLKGTGYLKNLTGLDACGWVILLDKEGESKLEPLNISKFKLKLIDGKEVKFTYKSSDKSTACMVGKVIELKSIKYK